jgi:carbon storage regulator CsrA
MLVLTRKLQEKIRIGDSITITVLRVKGNAVRLGIDAPRSVRVVRSELPPKDSDSMMAADIAAGDLDQAVEALSDDRSPADDSANPGDRIGETPHPFHKGPLSLKISRLATAGV